MIDKNVLEQIEELRQLVNDLKGQKFSVIHGQYKGESILFRELYAKNESIGIRCEILNESGKPTGTNVIIFDTNELTPI